jgi:hypothetical protein
MNTAFVLTTINPPTRALQAFSEGCRAVGWPCYVVGDRKTPKNFYLRYASFLSIDDKQLEDFAYARHCHENTYARKNIGYLEAVRYGAQIIVESDDDNLPYRQFFQSRDIDVSCCRIDSGGWFNVYRYFTDVFIWPRGFPLGEVPNSQGLLTQCTLHSVTSHCPVQQSLADMNPDVDAIFRLLYPMEIRFKQDTKVVLGPGTWCPFNSQNTTWWKEAFPLMYLPTHCSFRMTDIWRSLVAQRIGWEYGWQVAFHSPSVWQERNTHDLIHDFKEEVPGYLANQKIAVALENLNLLPDMGSIADNLILAYEVLIHHGFVGREETSLLKFWLDDMNRLLNDSKQC